MENKKHIKFTNKFKEKYGDEYVFLGEYTEKDSPILIKHKKCGCEYDIIPHYALRNKFGCPYCARKSLSKTHSTFSSELKELNANFIPIEKYKGQNEEIKFKCLSCGGVFTKTPKRILNILKTSTNPCPLCSDTISYPEKFISNFLNQLEVKYIYQYNFAKGCLWSKNYRYDFFIPDQNIIIEVNGIQHYRQTSFGNYSEILINDNQKKELALQNGMKYAAIDASRSSMQYISNSIQHSILSKIYDLSNIDWNLCSSNASKSIFNKVCSLYNTGKNYREISKITLLSEVTVSRYVREGFSLNICQKHPITNINKCKEVKCIELNKTFTSVREANLYLNKKNTNSTIYDCLHGRTKTAFGYHWEYLVS